MDDSELALFRAGDPAFFRKLNRRHRGFLMGVILSFQQDADWAEELYQQVWIAIWKQRKALRRGRSFAACGRGASLATPASWRFEFASGRPTA